MYYQNNDFRNYLSISNDHLEHHGILGQKWGVRRYQNPDGTLTPEGKLKLKAYKEKEGKKVQKRIEKTKAKIVKSGPEDFRYNIRKKKLQNLQKELKIVNKMKFSEMEAEKRLVGAKTLAAATAATGSVLLYTAPVGLAGVLAFPNAKNIKSSYRLGYDKEKQILSKRSEEIKKLRR